MTVDCGFCGKSQHEVAKLIAGPKVLICVECVDLCHEIAHPPAKLMPSTVGDPPWACKDCRWAKKEPEGPRLWSCLHAEAMIVPEPDYVTGKTERPRHTSCYGMRAGICGADGKLWEPRGDQAEFGAVIGFGELRDPDAPK